MELLDHDQLILQAQELDPLPMTATRLATLIADPNSEMREIVEAISLDTALTVKLLRVANSAASGAQSEITTVDRAVMRVGTGAVLSMVVAAGVRGRMLGKVVAYDLAEGELWQHSVAAALAAESLAGLTRNSVPPEVFTAALLHDVGKLVLNRFLEPEVHDFLRHARENDGLTPQDAESEVLQIGHAELGGLVADHWKLPRSIVLGIRYHHDPGRCQEAGEQRWIPWYVHLSNLVANRLGYLAGSVMPTEQDFEEPLEMVGMDVTGLEKLCFRTQLRIDEVGERFS